MILMTLMVHTETSSSMSDTLDTSDGPLSDESLSFKEVS